MKPTISIRDKIGFSRKLLLRQLSGKCDFVFFDHLGLASAQTMVPRSRRRPFGVFLHGIEAWKPLNRLQLRTLIQANVRVANSHFTAARIKAAHPEVGKINVCHLALGSAMAFDEPRTDLPTSETQVLERIGPRSVLIVGRMTKAERYKGHDELIQAWPAVKEAVPGAQLVVVGRGDDFPRLKERARSLGIQEAILFAGHVSDDILRAIYQRVSAFAMPSRGEGFGIVYLEAMLHRLACLGSVHDAASEIIVDGETGFLVNQDDTSELAVKLIQLLTDSSLRHRFGRNGFDRLRSSFSLERFESRISEILTKSSCPQIQICR